VRQGITVTQPLRGWDDAITLLFSSVRDQPRVAVIDEFPFLVKASPALPSIIQRELGPGGSAGHSSVRLLLCGSAMSVMGQLLAGHAPLRGRASLELLIRPFGYRDASLFWNVDDPELAVLLHAIVGGTPAYRREFVAFDAPANRADFDAWVLRTVLNPQSPLFREARYLLAEETEIRDPLSTTPCLVPSRRGTGRTAALPASLAASQPRSPTRSTCLRIARSWPRSRTYSGGDGGHTESLSR
jgi:hypothetical protein